MKLWNPWTMLHLFCSFWFPESLLSSSPADQQSLIYLIVWNGQLLTLLCRGAEDFITLPQGQTTYITMQAKKKSWRSIGGNHHRDSTVWRKRQTGPNWIETGGLSLLPRSVASVMSVRPSVCPPPRPFCCTWVPSQAHPTVTLCNYCGASKTWKELPDKQ